MTKKVFFTNLLLLFSVSAFSPSAYSKELWLNVPDHGHVVKDVNPVLTLNGLVLDSLRIEAQKLDLWVIVDTSGSAQDFSGVDVDGDGAFTSNDSILHAQVRGARQLVTALRSMPRGPDEKESRLQIGLIEMSDAKPSLVSRKFQLLPEEEPGFEPSQEDFKRWAMRDTKVLSPLTENADSLESSLRELDQKTPQGQTNLAAAIERVLIEPHRPDAKRVVFLLTDGEPTLPSAETKPTANAGTLPYEAAMKAVQEAATAGVTIHVFGPLNSLSKQIAEETKGKYLAVEKPGAIIQAISSINLSELSTVQVSSGDTKVFIDGSFQSQVPLKEGKNAIEVIATLKSSEVLKRKIEITYQAPELTYEERLYRQKEKERMERAQAAVKEKEDALEALRAEMKAVRAKAAAKEKQRRELTIEAEKPTTQ